MRKFLQNDDFIGVLKKKKWTHSIKFRKRLLRNGAIIFRHIRKMEGGYTIYIGR